jgi:TolB-like protein
LIQMIPNSRWGSRQFSRSWLAVAAVLATGCAGAPAPALAPIAPERARTELAAARIESSTRPGQPGAALRLGVALYHAGEDDAARSTLDGLMEQPGETGARAALYYAAASERQEDWSAARRGYARFLSVERSREVEARLRDVTRREAEVVVRSAIAREQALEPATFPARSVTVTPLRVSAADSSFAALGYGLADLLSTDLARSGQLQVVERSQMDALMRELELGASDRVDGASAPRMGRLLGARRVVGGTITVLPREQLRIDASISDVATADVTSTTPLGATLDQIFDAQKQLALRILAALDVTLTPAERAAIEQRPTKNLGAFLAYSRGVRDESMGRFPEAAAEFARAVSMDPGFAAAQMRLRGNPEPPPPGAGPGRAALVNRVNPSPAARLFAARERSDEIGALLERTESALIVIPVVLIPQP